MRCGPRKRVVGGMIGEVAEPGEPVQLRRAVWAIGRREVNLADVKASFRNVGQSEISSPGRRIEMRRNAFCISRPANTVILLFDGNERLYDPGTPT